MKVLLLGAMGMLGSDLVDTCPAYVKLIGATKSQVDVRDPAGIESALDRLLPDVLINATGYTAVDRAQSERGEAFAINAIGVGNIARACERRSVPLVHFSSDYIFSGEAERPYREHDAPAPINVYGESKLAGELAVISARTRALIIRTQWLFGVGGASFARTMLERARCDQQTRVVNDQWGRPTYARDVADAVWRLIDRGAFGVFHVANHGEATWYDVAKQIFARCGKLHLLASCHTWEVARPARRPRYSVLDTTKADEILGSGLPTWNTALGSFLATVPSKRGAPSD